jgi:radical SAM protein with 4Fe4S-binding SPASM domain
VKTFLPREDAGTILDLASAHAKDDLKTAEQKLDELSGYLAQFGLLLQAADSFDLGSGRLVDDSNAIDWDTTQIPHLKKHQRFKVTLEWPVVRIKASAQPAWDAETPSEYEDILKNCERYAKEMDRVNLGKWYVPMDWEILGAKVVVKDGTVYNDELTEALDEARKAGGGLLDVDMMGHSLWRRFCADQGDLNDELLNRLMTRRLRLRVLLLDPYVETQQMYEVMHTQEMNEKTEGTRRILPNYKSDNKIPSNGKGDILETLENLETKWLHAAELGQRDECLLEVRCTRRILPVSLNRFGDRMILTPYAGGGATRSSQSLLVRGISSLFQTYSGEFKAIWDDAEHTDVFLRSKPEPRPPAQAPGTNEIDLKYEHALDKHRRRIGLWVSGNEAPPFEVEVQPTTECQLKCPHCIGAHLGHVRPATEPTDLGRFESLFRCGAGGQRVERIRLSGLYGDPFHKTARKFSCELLKLAKKEGRSIVVITNGIGINAEVVDALKKLGEGDSCHVSLDAVNARQYKEVKGGDFFGQVERNFNTIPKNRAQKGIGFVVTQTNADSVEAAVELAQSWSADFIRFKPDIRPSHGIAWRTWLEARRRISLATPQNDKLKVYTTPTTWPVGRPGPARRCWSELLCTTITGDGKVYRCDHLAGLSEPIGDLKKQEFGTIWNARWMQNRERYRKTLELIDRRTESHCALCPPFAAYVNRAIERRVRSGGGW